MRNKKKRDILVNKYVEKECKDVKSSMVYSPGDIKDLCKNIWVDGYNEGQREMRELEEELRNKLWLSTGQTIEPNELLIIGEILARKMYIL